MLCAGNRYQRFLSLTTIFNVKHARNAFSSLTTEEKIFVATDKNRAFFIRIRIQDSHFFTELNASSRFNVL